MTQAVAEKGDPQGTLGKDEPTGRSACRTMVHDYKTSPMAGAGHDKDAEASDIEIGGRRPQPRRRGPMAAAEPEHALAPGSADALRQRGGKPYRAASE